jgi:hypothetical protein
VRAPPADSVTYLNDPPRHRRGWYVTGVREQIFAGPFSSAAAAEAALRGDEPRRPARARPAP